MRESQRGRDLLTFGNDFRGDPLSQMHVMRILARENRVLWIDSIGYRAPSASRRDLGRALAKLRRVARPLEEVEPNIFVLAPLALPAHGSAWARALNRTILRFQVARAMKSLGFVRPISFVYNPAAAVIAGHLDEERVVYHCVDEFTALDGVPKQLVLLERELLRRADLVIVCSERLLRAKSPHNRNTKLIRHGVAYAHFRAALADETRVPDDVARLPRPVLGYFGLMAREWIDVNLLETIADRFPSGSLVLIGAVTTDLGRLPSLANVHLLGRKPFATLPGYCKGFDVALNPFPINDVTLSANPLKVREYLAAGLPVVSTRIPEVEAIGHARIADGADEFVRAIEEALADPGVRRARSETMRAETWEARVAEIEVAMSQVDR